MEILDNKQGRTVEHEIAKRLDSNTSVSVSTGMFSIYAFYLLREKMKHTKGLKILLLSNPQTKNPQGVSIALDNTFWGTAEEGGLKRQLLLRYAAEECTHILERSRIRALRVPNSFGFKLIFIQNEHDSCVINPGMADFCADSLGFINSEKPQLHILHNKKEEVAQNLKKETKNYANMKAYSSAFQLAIESVIGKSQEVGAASFFSTELVSLNAEGVTSQSDFDIVAFVAVKRK